MGAKQLIVVTCVKNTIENRLRVAENSAEYTQVQFSGGETWMKGPLADDGADKLRYTSDVVTLGFVEIWDLRCSSSVMPPCFVRGLSVRGYGRVSTY